MNGLKCTFTEAIVTRFLFLFADVISIEKTGEHFRLIYDVKGRFTVHRITAEEAKVSAGISSVDYQENHFLY